VLRQSARSLLRQPGLLLALILSVALGVGSNAAVFAFVTGLVAVRSPLVDDTRVVTVRTHTGLAQDLLSSNEFALLAAQSPLFESVVAARETVSTIRSEQRSLTATVATVTSSGGQLFQLGIRGGAALSPGARERTFGMIDRITIDDVEYAAAATAPDWLDGLYAARPIAAWIVVPDAWFLEHDSVGRTLAVFARLQPGLSLTDAQRRLDEVAQGTQFTLADYTGLTPEAAAGMRRLRTLLTAAAAAVFFLACVNVAVLLLSRAARRSHEMSIRIALGVSRRTLALGLLVDAVLIAVPGAAAGLILGMWTADAIPLLLFEQDASQLTFVPDTTLVGLAVAACALIVLCCGMVPLVENRHDRPADVLRRQAPHYRSGISRLQAALVVLQMAGCCALVVAAAFLTDSFQSTLRTQSGRGIGERVLASVEASAGFGQEDAGTAYLRDVEQAASELPGVFSLAWIARPPGSAPSWHPVTLEAPDERTRAVEALLEPFTPASIDDVVLPPLAGRMFGGADQRGGCPVAVLNDVAASHWFGDRAVGRWIRSRAGDFFEVVGVVKHARATGRAVPLVYYYPEQGDPLAAGEASVTFDIPISSDLRRGVLNSNAISDNYFQVMGGTVTRPAGAPTSAPFTCRTGLLNREAADLYFGGDAVGGALIDTSGRRTTIVGIVDEPPLRALQRDIPPTIYVRTEDEYSPRMTLILATPEAPAPFLEGARGQLNAVGGGMLRRLATLDEHLSRTALAAERIAALLVGTATVVGLVLGVLGLHRAVADDLIRRQHEYATRSALGSPAWRLVPVLLHRGGRWATAGSALGLVAAAAIGVWLRGLTGFDAAYAAWVWWTGPAVLLLGVVAASILPALRVMRVDPLIVMKN
jgi:ABC-type lipoprotein release transport system permease subunit